MNAQSTAFTARVVAGAGKGTSLGTPTLNLDLENVPEELEDGVYAVHALIDDTQFGATMHYGARPTLDLPRSCEVHLLDASVDDVEEVHVELVGKIREVGDFGSEDGLKQRIAKDIAEANEIFGKKD